MAGRPNSTAGFTLVELLVVIGIIGILAAVALAQYATYKQRGVDTQMESCLQAGRLAMEAYFVEHETYATANEITLHDSYGFRYTPGVSFTITAKTDARYRLQVCAVGGSSAALVFDSTVGLSSPTSACS